MAKRLSFEQLAMNRTRRRLEKIKELVAAISVDWYDSEVHSISDRAEEMRRPIEDFEKEAAELWADYEQRCAE